MNGYPLDPNDVIYTPEGWENYQSRKTRIQAYLGYYDDWDDPEQEDEEEFSTESPAPLLPTECRTSHGSPSKPKTTTKHLTISTTSAKFSLNCAAGKSSKSAAHPQQEATREGGREAG